VNFTLNAKKCLELFPVKLGVKLLTPAENFTVRQTTRLAQNSVNSVCYT